MKNFLLFLILFFSCSYILIGQETYKFFGSAYNETQNAGGPLTIELTLLDGINVTGYVDNDPYPGQVAFCGAGEFTGTLNQNVLSLSFISQDPDEGCGFDHGWLIEYVCDISSEFDAITGRYTISRNGVFHSEGNLFLRRESQCEDIEGLRELYQSRIGTVRELYTKQYLCLAEKACTENKLNGADGWAGGFIPYMFDYMSTHNEGQRGLDFPSLPYIAKEAYFSDAGMYHVVVELLPAFFTYCSQVESEADIEKWTSDHDAFLSEAIDVCFDEQIIGESSCTILPPSLCAVYLSTARGITKEIVKALRDEAQAYCGVTSEGGDISDLKEELPDPLTEEDLFSNELEEASDILISTDNYFLAVGESYQLNSILKEDRRPNKGRIDLKSTNLDINYFLSVDSTIATISDSGILSIHATDMPLINDRRPFFVFAEINGKVGVGQFAIYDKDSENDLLVDSFEEKIPANSTINSSTIGNGLYSDLDLDGLSDFFEILTGTNPYSADTDEDSFIDAFEVAVRTDPQDPNKTPISITTTTSLLALYESTIEIYPTSFTQDITIKFPEGLIGSKLDEIAVIDIAGRILFQSNNNSINHDTYHIKLQNLPSGVYLIKLSIENQSIFKKLRKI